MSTLINNSRGIQTHNFQSQDFCRYVTARAVIDQLNIYQN